jgi:hypothetical protein
MFLIPLNQIESVQLVAHALRVAGGAADCSACPAARVCMKQCLTIAEAVERMLRDGTLPALGEEPAAPAPPEPAKPGPKGGLKVVK